METINLDDFSDGPRIFSASKFFDNRGYFQMVFNFDRLRTLLPQLPVMNQLNCIVSKQNSLRGFHGSNVAENHWKILACLSGEIRDAYLDIRTTSTTFGKVAFENLNPDEMCVAVIPPGFAHAFQGLAEDTIAIYMTNILYEKQNEVDIYPLDSRWSGIWNDHSVLSLRDQNARSFDALLATDAFK
jgi:dTDP-4-dehydrorhamnose 3,5-epimerase-like enzyme